MEKISKVLNKVNGNLLEGIVALGEHLQEIQEIEYCSSEKRFSPQNSLEYFIFCKKAEVGCAAIREQLLKPANIDFAKLVKRFPQDYTVAYIEDAGATLGKHTTTQYVYSADVYRLEERLAKLKEKERKEGIATPLISADGKSAEFSVSFKYA